VNTVSIKREVPTESISLQQEELVQRLAHHATQNGLQTTAINGVELLRAESPTRLLPAVYQPCLCFVAQGSKRALLNGASYTYDPLHYLVVSMTMPVYAEITGASPTKPYLALSIKIDTAELAALLPNIQATTRRESSDHALYSTAMTTSMLDVVLRLVRLFETPQDSAVLAPLALREIYYRALTGELGERLQQVIATDSYAQRVGRAIELLRNQYHLPLRVQTLADTAHMSLSSLHQHFKSITAMSPLQYQKQLRLHEARRLMLNGGMDAANASYRVGYASPSQFSRDYKRLFGSPPKQQLMTIRTATPSNTNVLSE
jgi:AraC-like DNA-binding protein